MRTINFLTAALAIIICSVLLLSNIKGTLYNKAYYHEEFEKLGVYESINESQADSAIDNLHNYFKNKGELNEFWDKSEKNHLADVKELVKKGTYWYYGFILAVIILLYAIYRTNPKRYFTNISIVFIAAGLITGVSQLLAYIISSNFESAFVRFHEIFFPQGNWMFSSGNMITLFPEQFFMDISMKILQDTLMSGLLLLVLGIIGLVYYRTKRSPRQSHPSKKSEKSSGKHH